MGSIFRSESMALCHMYLQNEAAFDIVAELGRLGIVSFIDLNQEKNYLQRKFNSELSRCDSIDSQLSLLFSQMNRSGINFNNQMKDDFALPKYRDLHEYEQQVKELNDKLLSLQKNISAINLSYVRAKESYLVLSNNDELYSKLDLSDLDVVDSSDTTAEVNEIESIIVLIHTEKIASLERLLWRFFGHNIFTKIIKQTSFENENGTDFEMKTSMAIFYKGKNIGKKLQKILLAYKAQIFNVKRDSSQREEEMIKLEREIKELEIVKNKSDKYLTDLLLNNASELCKIRIQLVKFHLIFSTLNKFNYDLTHKTMICELWCPESDRALLNRVLERFNQNNSGLAPSVLNIIPLNEIQREIPTFYRLNKFTVGFQNIVDSYGVANYKEMNPAPYTAVTFPFLFAIMFGDAGHGLIMTIFALWMVLTEKKLIAQKSKNEIWIMFFNGRYIILLMGIFAIYSGLIYNDTFSKSINFFGSSFMPPKPYQKVGGNLSEDHLSSFEFYNTSMIIDPSDSKQYKNTPYPFGLDPAWQFSENKILFTNSYKMKLSVILGVSQMLFGVALSFFNHTYFSKRENIFFEFIPQVLFVLNIFGYMNLMIFIKWFKYNASNAGDAPNILINLINMFLMKYPNEKDTPTNLKEWYPHQKQIQTTLLLIALLCIPWILFPKVYYLWRKAKNLSIGSYEIFNNDEENPQESLATSSPFSSSSSSNHSHQNVHGNKFELGDTFIHQAIHTIEYCLGSISHTASYLRLWALSLAHGQLSEVLWSMVLRKGISAKGPLILSGAFMYVSFAAWAVLSVAVLIIMEGLSAFLHALRLHWVEFQSKFYTGNGVLFEAYSFEKALTDLDLI